MEDVGGSDRVLNDYVALGSGGRICPIGPNAFRCGLSTHPEY